MKKLMIAAAIVCAAAMSQAASMAWGGSLETSAGISGQEAPGWANVGAVYQLWALDTAVTDTSLFSYNGSVLTAEGVTATLADDHTVTLDDWNNGNFTVELPDAPAADLNGYYAVVLFDATADNKIYSVETFLMTAVADDAGGKVLQFTDGGDATMLSIPNTAIGQNWQDVAAVPEPTSGLLLLIGVAGLALKRRRA